MNEIKLTPSPNGADCLGNGQHDDVEIQCDEFDHSTVPGRSDAYAENAILDPAVLFGGMHDRKGGHVYETILNPCGFSLISSN